jgi:hypothetical protein
MGIIELVLLAVAFFAAGSVTTIVVIANNKPLARKLLDS